VTAAGAAGPDAAADLPRYDGSTAEGRLASAEGRLSMAAGDCRGDDAVVAGRVAGGGPGGGRRPTV
jgi:hypothetical protein